MFFIFWVLGNRDIATFRRLYKNKTLDALHFLHGCPTGGVVASGAGHLNAKFVFHAVGPRWKGGTAGESDLLRAAYRTCLELAVQHDCQSIAFPSISTGIYGYPIQQAAPLAIQTVVEFLREHEVSIQLVRFCLFSNADFEVYADALNGVKQNLSS